MFYTYIYLDPRKKGPFTYGKYTFEHESFYVGKGHGNQHTTHLREALNHDIIKGNKHKFYKIKKILKENLEPNIIKVEENLSEQEAFDLEIWLIWAIGRSDLKMGPLVNHTDGGDGVSGNIISEETRERLRRSSQGNKNGLGYKHSDESKLKISVSSTGKNNGMYGKTHTFEVKNKISQLQTGRIKSEKERKDIAERMSNRLILDQTREKLRVSKLGNKIALGYKQTAEHKLKRVESRKKTLENRKKMETL